MDISNLIFVKFAALFISLKFIFLAHILHSLSKKKKLKFEDKLFIAVYDSIECVWPIFFCLKN